MPSDQTFSLPYLPTPVSPFHAEPLHPGGGSAWWGSLWRLVRQPRSCEAYYQRHHDLNIQKSSVILLL